MNLQWASHTDHACDQQPKIPGRFPNGTPVSGVVTGTFDFGSTISVTINGEIHRGQILMNDANRSVAPGDSPF